MTEAYTAAVPAGGEPRAAPDGARGIARIVRAIRDLAAAGAAQKTAAAQAPLGRFNVAIRCVDTIFCLLYKGLCVLCFAGAEMPVSECADAGLWDVLGSIPDRRGARGRRYPLRPVLVPMLAAMLSGANDLRAVFR